MIFNILKILLLGSLLMNNCQGTSLEIKFHRAIEYWTEILCTLPKTKSFVFHGVFANSTEISYNFFDDLLRSINEHCEPVILLKIHFTGQPYPKNVNSSAYSIPLDRNAMKRRGIRGLTSTGKLLHRKSRIRGTQGTNDPYCFDLWNVNIIFVGDTDSFEELLDFESPFQWTNREHFILLTIWNDTFEKTISKDRRSSIERVLKKLWLEHQVQNAFVNEPLVNDDNVIYTYNPFAMINGTGRIFDDENRN